MAPELLVAAGGAIGALARHWLGPWAQGLAAGTPFPVGTLLVNLLGCAAIGTLAGVAERHGALPAEWRAFLVVGVLGGFTTFSAFGLETVELLRRDAWPMAAGYVLLSVLGGVAVLWLCLAGTAK